MGGSYKARCVVLKKTKLGETDLIVTMLDENGTQVRGVAKGARKPGNRRFGARLEPYSVADLVLYPGKSLESITDVRCVTTNATCRESLGRSSACAVIAELADKATRDGEIEPRAVACIEAAFAAIGQAPETQASLLACATIFKLAAMMGIRPALHECAACGGPLDDDALFDLYSGGMVCSDCATGEPTHPHALAGWLDTLLGSTFAELCTIDVQEAPVGELLQLSDSWLSEYLGLKLKTISFLLACF